MKLICPGCGLTASAEAWENDAACRETLVVAAHLPPPLPPVVLSYLSLFRPEKKALTWKKALRLVKELADLFVPGFVEVERKTPRPCPPTTWARAMGAMLERRDSLKLPIAGHMYLRKVAYDLADQADAQNERQGEDQKRYEHHRPDGEPRTIKSPLAAFAAGEIESLPGGE